MAIVSINENYLNDIAEAIREKTGTNSLYKPKQMAAAISGIEGGGASNVNNTYMIPYELQELPPYVFKHDNLEYFNLSYVTFDKYISPSGAVHSLTTIGRWAFYGQRMTKIDLPETVTTIDQDAFQNCCSTSVYIILRGTTLVHPNCFSIHNHATNSQCRVFLYVPKAILDQAKAHYNGAEVYVNAIEDNPSICG